MLKIAKNVLLEGFRELRRAPHAVPGAGPTTRLFALQNCPESITSFTQQLTRDESLRHFLESVEEFAPEDKKILIFCGLEDQTCADVAVQLGLNEDAVIKRWQRLRSRLRERPWAQEILVQEG